MVVLENYILSWQLNREYVFDGQSVKYDVRGSGPAVILVHGTPWSSFSWRHIIDSLSASYTVYFYDFLGYGQSKMAANQNVSLEIQGDLLSELIMHWELRAPTVIAHDFGGATALRAHLLNGSEFKKLALCNVVAISPWGSPFFRHVNKFEQAFSAAPDYIHEAILAAYVDGAMYSGMSPETFAGIQKPWLGERGKQAFYRQMAQADRCFTDQIEDQLHRIDFPCHIFWGEKDEWIPVERGRELATRIPDSKFTPIESAGHLLQEDQPEKLGQLLMAFLADTPESS